MVYSKHTNNSICKDILDYFACIWGIMNVDSDFSIAVSQYFHKCTCDWPASVILDWGLPETSK